MEPLKRSTIEKNMRLMETLDDAWNAQDWAEFEKRHAKDVDVFWLVREVRKRAVLRRVPCATMSVYVHGKKVPGCVCRLRCHA
jgi:hypothetical protein